MGLLRLYLALCVIAAHSNNLLPWGMHTGPDAVLIFFMISGFYMEMVVSSKYSSKRDFYLSRFLRIFPPYFFILGITVILCVAFGLIFGDWLTMNAYVRQPLEHVGLAGFLFTTISNLVIFGQDWVMFLSDTGNGLHVTKDFTEDSHPLWRLLLVPTAWSIGMELTFYLVVPFLNRLRTGWLIGVASLSIALKFFASIQLGLTHDPWSYRCFPFELSLFIFGMLGHRIYCHPGFKRMVARIKPVGTWSYLIAVPVLLLLINIQTRVTGRLGKMFDHDLVLLISNSLWIIGIPLLFHVFKNQKADRFIGELSYPVYLLHWIIITALIVLAERWGTSFDVGWVATIITLILSVGIYLHFIIPLDARRHALAHSKPEKA